MKDDADHKLLRIAEGAAFLSLSATKVRRMIDAGELPSVRIGRVIRLQIADLQNYVATRRFKGEVPVSA
jgi:excisionase family DNA binding protein